MRYPKGIAKVRNQLKQAKEQSDWYEVIDCCTWLIGFDKAVDRSAYNNRSKAYRNLGEHGKAQADNKQYKKLLAEDRRGRHRES